jgi:Ca-activated chloride channel family protein
MMQLTSRCLLLLAAMTLVVAAIAPARAQDAPTLTISQLDASAYPKLRAIATVLDDNGVPVTGLTADDFQAFDADSELKISGAQSVQDASLPLSVVVTMDVSGSMAGDPLSEAKQAATAFVRQLGPNDQATLIVFNDTVTTAIPFTNDPVLLTNGFANLQAAGGTALYEAVQASAFAAYQTTAPRRAVVLLTDGQNETQQSAVTGEEALAAAKAAGVPMFTVGFGDQPDTQYLQSLSDATGGEYLPATAASVGAVYDQIAALLRSQYVIDVQADAPSDGSEAQLRLVANVGGTEVQTNAGYARGAAPPTPTPQPSPTPRPTPVPAGAKTGGGRGTTPLIVFGVIVGVLVMGGAGFASFRWLAQRRVLRHQTAVIAGNPMQAAAQPLPRQEGALFEHGGAVEAGSGRLVERRPEGDRIHQLGAGPVVIGSSRQICTIILPTGPDVAPEHARIWLRDGGYLLHHAGGFRRRTLVNGRESEWVRLEHGDELQIGPHRFLFEDPEAAEAV